MSRFPRYVLNTICLCTATLLCHAGYAEQTVTIPETITLEFALKQVDGIHPDLERAGRA